MTDDLTRRLEAVERALTDGHTDLSNVATDADFEHRLSEVERRLDDVTTRLDDLDATTQALRGYLGGVDGVTEDVERRADLALSKAEAVEAAVFDGQDGLAVERLPPGNVESSTDDRNGPPSADSASETAETPHGRAASAVCDASHGQSAGSHTREGPVRSSAPRLDTTDDGDRSLVGRLRDAL